MPAPDQSPKPLSSFSQPPAGSLRVLQFTDTHLYADADGTLLGLDTLDSLNQCIELARAHHWPADLVLATGDLVHDGSPQGYHRLHGIFEALGTPVQVLPGNHDDPAIMQQELVRPPIEGAGEVTLDPWHIVLLDSNIPDSDKGRLAEEELARLDLSLQRHPDQHTLICLHHQPVPMGSAWIDTMQVENPEPFFKIVEKHPQVRGILWGHVHQEFDILRNGVRLMASPSTCIQFLPGSSDFAIDLNPPGYRWLVLHSDGQIDTGVMRLAAVPPGLDAASGGY